MKLKVCYPIDDVNLLKKRNERLNLQLNELLVYIYRL